MGIRSTIGVIADRLWSTGDSFSGFPPARE
jgi:hypothetical protein